MRTPARPRLPDGDCVFISDERTIAGTNSSSTHLFLIYMLALLRILPQCKHEND